GLVVSALEGDAVRGRVAGEERHDRDDRSVPEGADELDVRLRPRGAVLADVPGELVPGVLEAQRGDPRLERQDEHRSHGDEEEDREPQDAGSRQPVWRQSLLSAGFLLLQPVMIGSKVLFHWSRSLTPL